MPVMPCEKDGNQGFKWGEEGVCFIGPDAKERAEAVGRAVKAADSGMLLDASTSLKATIDDTTGFLTAPVTLARTGVQYYMGYELGLTDRALDKIGVFRPVEEVFHRDTMASFENMVVTDDHPAEAVTVDNVKTLQGGQVSGIAQSGPATVGGMVTVTDKNLLQKVLDGKVEVSVGYSHDLVHSPGNYMGLDYEYEQRNIRGNHLAIVDAGRCGAACKLTIDHKGGLPMIITLDGSKFEVADEQLAQAILNEQASHDAQLKAKDEEMSKAEKEKEEAMKDKDKAEAAKDAMSKDVMTTDQLNTLVNDRATLIATVRGIMGDKAPDCDCPVKAMAAVVDHVIPDMDLAGKSDDYIAAAYDMAVVKHSKAKGSMDKLQDDLIKDDKGNAITRDTARNKYMAAQGFTVQEV